MMKRILNLSTMFFSTLSLFAQSQQTIKVEEQKKVYIPEQVYTERLVNDLDISVTPINATELNELTFRHIQPEKDMRESLRAHIELQEKSFTTNNTLHLASVMLNSYQKKGLMSEPTAMSLLMRLWQGEAMGYVGNESEVLLRKTPYPDTYNPFIYNGLSFTTFKVVFENKGKEIERIKLDEFQLSIGKEVLYPLKKVFFETQLFGFPEKMLNYLRFYAPDELILLPQQRIEKYIAFPNIKTPKAVLQLQFIRDKKNAIFEFRETEELTKKYIYLTDFQMKSEGFVFGELQNTIYAISFADGFTFALKGSNLIVDNEMLKQPIAVYALSVSEDDKTVAVRYLQNVVLSDIKRNTIMFDFGIR